MLVLLVGMRANDSNADFAASAGLRQAPSGFMEPQDLFLNSARSGVDGSLRRYGHRAEEYRRNIERGRCGSGSPDGLFGEGIVMAAINWGYAINKPRVIDIDSNNLRKSDEILREMPELQTCIGCGGCTATCTAGNLTDFNFRKLHTLVRRGEYQGVYEQMNKCMLCGKCRLVCPRGINTRAVVMLIKRKLGDF